MSQTKYEKFLRSPPVDPKHTSKWENTSPDEKLGLTRQYFKDKRAWRKKHGSVPKHDFSGLSDSEIVSSLATMTRHFRGKENLKKEFKQRSIDNPTIYEQLKRAKTKEAKRDKSEDLVFRKGKAKGGLITKSKSRTGHTDYRTGGMIYNTKVKRG